MQMESKELDLRHLPPPEPMLRIMEALAGLEGDATLVARTPFYPENLFPILQERGYRWEILERCKDRSCRLRISRS